MNRRRNIGIIILVVVIIAVGFWIFKTNHTKSDSSQLTIAPTASAVKPTQPVVRPSNQSSPSVQNSVLFNTTYTSIFTNECASFMGQQATSRCQCAANYLVAHYTQAQLMQLAAQFHSSKQFPSEYRAAYRTCPAK